MRVLASSSLRLGKSSGVMSNPHAISKCAGSGQRPDQNVPGQKDGERTGSQGDDIEGCRGTGRKLG